MTPGVRLALFWGESAGVRLVHSPGVRVQGTECLVPYLTCVSLLARCVVLLKFRQIYHFGITAI